MINNINKEERSLMHKIQQQEPAAMSPGGPYTRKVKIDSSLNHHKSKTIKTWIKGDPSDINLNKITWKL
jgi:hypothetical protein